jgi:hypothetical protein
MIALNLDLDGDGVWGDLKEIIEADNLSIAALQGGMVSGAPSVAIRIDVEPGVAIVAQTSLVLFLTAADALKARYGDPRAGL